MQEMGATGVRQALEAAGLRQAGASSHNAATVSVGDASSPLANFIYVMNSKKYPDVVCLEAIRRVEVELTVNKISGSDHDSLVCAVTAPTSIIKLQEVFCSLRKSGTSDSAKTLKFQTFLKAIAEA